MPVVKLFIWVVLMYWIFWYCSIILERVNRGAYQSLVDEVRTKAESTSGVMYWLGFFLYAPYLQPGKSFMAWIVAVVLMFVLA